MSSAIHSAMARRVPVLVFLLCLFLSGTATRTRADAGPNATKASLRVTVENVSPQGGMMRLGLYPEATYYDDSARPVAELDVAATAPVQTVEFTNVPPGTYAIQVLQDLNGNGRMDFTLVGLPAEPYGFSRDGRAFVTKPAFARVAVALNAGANAPQTIHLWNSDAAGPAGAPR